MEFPQKNRKFIKFHDVIQEHTNTYLILQFKLLNIDLKKID